MVKLADIARETGFSTCTVSKVLNGGSGAERYSEQCRQKVRETAERLGYHRNFAGRALRRGRTDTLGVLLPDWTSYGVMDPFLAAILGSVESAVRSQGLQTLVLGSEDLERLGSALRENRTDGLIACTFNEYPELIGVLEKCGQPAVRLFGENPGKLPAVRLDQEAGTFAATEHLAQLGHRCVAWMGPDSSDVYGNTSRYSGFQRAARQYGLVTRSLGVNRKADGQLAREIEWSADYICRAGKEFWDDCTGLVCYHDPLAFGALEGLRRLGLRVPRDVSVVGFDNVVATLASPPLSSVDFMLREATDVAVGMLLKWLETGRRPQRDASVTPRLHVASSSAKPRGQ